MTPERSEAKPYNHLFLLLSVSRPQCRGESEQVLELRGKTECREAKAASSPKHAGPEEGLRGLPVPTVAPGREQYLTHQPAGSLVSSTWKIFIHKE